MRGLHVHADHAKMMWWEWNAICCHVMQHDRRYEATPSTVQEASDNTENTRSRSP